VCVCARVGFSVRPVDRLRRSRGVGRFFTNADGDLQNDDNCIINDTYYYYYGNVYNNYNNIIIIDDDEK